MAELIRAKHGELGVVCEVPNTSHYLDNGWVPVGDDVPTTAEQRSLFDPASVNADQVVAYLATVDDPAEHDRVLASEKAGKGRATVLGWKPGA